VSQPRHGLSGLGGHLTSNAPVQLAPIAAWVHQFYDLHRFMFEAVRDHEPQYTAAFGKTSEAIWEEHIYRNPIEMRRFQAFMEAVAIPIGQEIAERVDFSGLAACAPGARERTESEYRGLSTDAGFTDVEVVRLEGLRDLIIARKP